jgi:hypothetical protein
MPRELFDGRHPIRRVPIIKDSPQVMDFPMFLRSEVQTTMVADKTCETCLGDASRQNLPSFIHPKELL